MRARRSKSRSGGDERSAANRVPAMSKVGLQAANLEDLIVHFRQQKHLFEIKSKLPFGDTGVYRDAPCNAAGDEEPYWRAGHTVPVLRQKLVFLLYREIKLIGLQRA